MEPGKTVLRKNWQEVSIKEEDGNPAYGMTNDEFRNWNTW